MDLKVEHSPAHLQWQKIGTRPHHGICIPLFSLVTEKSCGIGEYLDLIPLIQWASEVHLDVIQLLPLNDTGLGTSPYSALSAFALNPIHLSLDELDGINLIENSHDKIMKMRYWNTPTRVKYYIVRELKMSFLKELFEKIFPDVKKTAKYNEFITQNDWLKPYALFRVFKEKHLWIEWEKWPKELQILSSSQIEQHYLENKEEADFFIFLQFLCYQQFAKTKQFADQKKVLLKGDIPILIGRDSAEVWVKPNLFDLRYAAGAPPDMYSQEGQYWGFPAYNWKEHEKEHYRFWKERLRLAALLYHLYRIDHVVGFYRLWAIPAGKQAKEGSFIPASEQEQRAQGEKIMKLMLESAPILPIGEDLGLVPPWVKESLISLGIPGTRVMRWERRWDTDKGFIPPKDYKHLTMTTVSTHDTDTLQLWWRHFPVEAKEYSAFKGWDYQPFLTLERQKSILFDSHHSNSIFHINLFPEYLALFPEFVSHNPNAERINIPGKVLDINWTYRLHQPLEKIAAHQPLRKLFQELIPKK